MKVVPAAITRWPGIGQENGLIASTVPPHIDLLAHANMTKQLALELPHFDLQLTILGFKNLNLLVVRIFVALRMPVRAEEQLAVFLTVLIELLWHLKDDAAIAACDRLKVGGCKH